MISKIIDSDKIDKVQELIYDAERIVIVSHLSPDGDAVGSSLGLYHFLHEIEKEAVVIFPDSYPDFLSWMPAVDKTLTYSLQKEAADIALSDSDLIISVDFNTPNRIGAMQEAFLNSKAKKILIDHHLNPEPNVWDLVISYPQMPSSCEMVFRVICRVGHAADITKQCAECLYTGMMTDTGSFSFNSNNAEMYYIIGELLKKGIDKDEIHRNVYNTYTVDRMRLMGYILAEKMQIFPEQKASLMTLTLEEQEKFNFKKGDAEGLVNLPLSIKGIIFSVFMKEDKDKIKISLRSQGKFPVNEVSSKYFNGGGHLNAAGGESYKSMEETIKIFDEVLNEYKETLIQQ